MDADLNVRYEASRTMTRAVTRLESPELTLILISLSETNQRLGALAETLSFLVRQALDRRARSQGWWYDPAHWAAAATWVLAGSIIGALIAR